MNTRRTVTAMVDGVAVTAIDPAHFSARPVAGKGRGLFCEVDLQPGDCWWVHDWSDPRWTQRVIPWSEFRLYPPAEQEAFQVIGYLDHATKNLILCTEPFCRVNHADPATANCESNEQGHSIVTRFIPAGTEITIPYDFEMVLSLSWKFPEFREMLTDQEWADDAILFQSVNDHPKARAFLQSLM